jgi:hypothetical protein
MPNERVFLDPIASATDRGGNREHALIPELGFNSRGGVAQVILSQRIYDSSAGWCWYQSSALTETPATTDTTPNHTDNLVAGTYERLT